MKELTKEEIKKEVAALSLHIVAIIGIISLRLIALVLINDWHLMSLLGTPEIGWMQAFVISLTVSIFTSGYRYNHKEKPKGEFVKAAYTKYGLIILIAWILQAV